jgi:hypothetical protein
MLWRVRQSIPISSKILEGTALSTPSCSTACTNLLCSSGVQSTYMHTVQEQLSFQYPTKIISQKSFTFFKKKNKNLGFHKLLVYEICEDPNKRDLWNLFPSIEASCLIKFLNTVSHVSGSSWGEVLDTRLSKKKKKKT